MTLIENIFEVELMAAKHEADNRVNIGQSASGRSFSMCPESEVSLQKHNLQNTNSWAN